MGTAFAVCFGYWLGASCIFKIVAHVCNTHLTSLQILSLTVRKCLYYSATTIGGGWALRQHSRIHSQKQTTCSGMVKTGLNNVLLPTLFKVVNNTEQVDEPELACNQV